jgi:hypothetical protein
MNTHPLSANAAYGATLQECRAFASRPSFPSFSVPQRVFGEALLIRFKLFPTDVANVNTRNYELPFRPRNFDRTVLAVGQTAGANATINERTRIPGVMQHLQDSRVLHSHPMQLVLA